jgi:hypothetical protein
MLDPALLFRVLMFLIGYYYMLLLLLIVVSLFGCHLSLLVVVGAVDIDFVRVDFVVILFVMVVVAMDIDVVHHLCYSCHFLLGSCVLGMLEPVLLFRVPLLLVGYYCMLLLLLIVVSLFGCYLSLFIVV